MKISENNRQQLAAPAEPDSVAGEALRRARGQWHGRHKGRSRRTQGPRPRNKGRLPRFSLLHWFFSFLCCGSMDD